MNHPDAFLCSYEQPRPSWLAPNLLAACFPLMKLMPARFILARACDAVLLHPGGHLAETTSGTFGLALAMLAAAHSYNLTLVSADSLMDTSLRRRLELLGANLVIVEDRLGSGAQDERLRRLRAIFDERPETFWPRQYDNPDNSLSYGRLAEWFVRIVGHIDCLVACVGSGGSLCGTGRFLRMLFPDLVIIAVDTHRSCLFGQPVGRRLLRGLGNSIIPANLIHEMVDEVHWVGALPAFAETRRLYRERALFMGPTSGAAALVGQWYAHAHPGAMTAVILPDEGYRYQETVYNDEWLSALQGWPLAIAATPLCIDKIEEGSEADWHRMAWARRTLTTVSA
jgi:cysteine synthase A